jgi:ribosomal protein S12 methylthiotransferase
MKNDDKTIKTIAMTSLGCPKNLVDSERMLGLLTSAGLIITHHTEQADALIINTCGFIDAATQESLEAIRQAAKLKESGRCKRIIVVGCLAQRQRTELLAQVPQIDRLVGVFDRESILRAVLGKTNPRLDHGHYLAKYSVSGPMPPDRARFRLTPRHWAYLRITEGCSQGCTFCTIPSIRGPLRSKPPQQIVAEGRELAADGAVEINLIGQDTTSYGTDIDYADGLAGLLRLLDRRFTDVRWLRLMYAYPSCFSDAMVHAIAQCDRVVKYVDLPLQHINDDILRRMRRRVTRAQTEALLEKLRRLVPGIAIRTTLISGCPGETEAQHRELLQFVRDWRFDMLGVFPYSPERGTAMGRMAGQVPDQVKHERVGELMLAQQEIAFARACAMKGRTIQVMVEGPGADQTRRKGEFLARAAFQAPEIDSLVHVRGTGLHPGQFVDVNVIGSRGYDLVAQPVGAGRTLRVLH